MAHNLFRLREKTLNTPQLMSIQGFDSIAKYLDERCDKDFKLEAGDESHRQDNSRYSFNSDLGVATLSVDGPLTYRPVTLMGMDCGGTSYTQLKEDFTYLVENGAKTIALTCDSPGGEAHGLFPTAQYMRDLADSNGVKILAYVDGTSASAGYGLTSIADEVIVSPGSEVGSVGVVVRLLNDSKALEKEGYERSFVYSGASKVPFAKDGSFRPEFIEDIQSKVDSLYGEFTNFISVQRNITVEAVKATEAKTFLPKEAKDLGLIDQVMTVEQFYNYLADSAQRPEGNTVLKNKLFNMNKTNEETPDMTHLAQLQSLQSELEAAKTQLAEFTSVKESLTTLQAAFAEKQAELSTALEQVKELNSYKEQVKTQSRQDKLKAVGQDETVAKALASLDDNSFEAALAGFTASFEKQKQVLQSSGMMEELGGEGAEPEASQQNDSAKDRTEAALKQKLGLK